MHVPSDQGLSEKLKQYDRFLFCKWNPKQQDFEVWIDPYPVDCKVTYLRKPAARKLLSCHGGRGYDVLERLWGMDVENRRNESIEKMLDKMDAENRNIEKEKTFGSEQDRYEQRESMARMVFENGLVASSAGKLG